MNDTAGQHEVSAHNGASGYLINTWYHLVGTYTAATNTVTLYINGVSQNDNINNSWSAPTPYGVLSFGQKPDWTGKFQGYLDELRISNIARSAGWIATEYNNQSSPSTFETFGSGILGGSPTIEQQIEIFDNEYNPCCQTVGPNLGMALIDTNNYTGATYYFEVIAYVTSGSGTGNITLTYNAGTGQTVNGSTTNVTISNINTTSPARYRSAAFSPTGAQNAYVSSWSSTTGGLQVVLAHIIIVQSSSTAIANTVSYIQMLGVNSGIGSGPDTIISNPSFWTWNSTKYDGTVTVYLEATINNSASGTTYASLYPYGSSCSGQVGGSSINATGTTTQRIRSGDFSGNLTNGTTYMVCSHASSSTTGAFANANLIIQQTSTGGLTKIELQKVGVNNYLDQTGTSYVSQGYDIHYDPANWAGGTFTYYYGASMNTTAGGTTGYAQLYNTSNSTAIANSQITTTNTTPVLVTSSSSLTMPTSVSELDTQIKNSNTSNTTQVNVAWLTIDVSNLQVPENLLLFIPLLFFLPKIVESINKRRKLRLAMQQSLLVNNTTAVRVRKQNAIKKS